MDSIRIPAKDEAISQGLAFLSQSLRQHRVGAKEANRAMLMAEEAMVKLHQHAAPDSQTQLAVINRMGSLSIRVTVPGERFEFDETMDFGLDLELDEEDGQTEAAIRNLLLHAFRDKIRYKHQGRLNTVAITVKESEKRLLYWTVSALLLSIVAGLVLKAVLPAGGVEALDSYVLDPIKTMFLNALKMVVAPVVFFSILSCVSQFSNLSDFGKTGGKVMGFYMFTTVVAIAVGAGAFLLLRPGSGGAQIALQGAQAVAGAEEVNISILDTIVNIVPSNIVQPFLDADMLQIIFIAILCGVAVGMIGDYSRPLKDFFEGCNTLFLKVTIIIVGFIPVAVFCSICSPVMLTGGDTLVSLLYFMAAVLVGMAAMMAVYCLLILVVGHLNPPDFPAQICSRYPYQLQPGLLQRGHALQHAAVPQRPGHLPQGLLLLHPPGRHRQHGRQLRLSGGGLPVFGPALRSVSLRGRPGCPVLLCVRPLCGGAGNPRCRAGMPVGAAGADRRAGRGRRADDGHRLYCGYVPHRLQHHRRCSHLPGGCPPGESGGPGGLQRKARRLSLLSQRPPLLRPAGNFRQAEQGRFLCGKQNAFTGRIRQNTRPFPFIFLCLQGKLLYSRSGVLSPPAEGRRVRMAVRS